MMLLIRASQTHELTLGLVSVGINKGPDGRLEWEENSVETDDLSVVMPVSPCICSRAVLWYWVEE